MDQWNSSLLFIAGWAGDVWDSVSEFFKSEIMEVQESIWKLIALGAIAVTWWAITRAFAKFDKRFDHIEEKLEEVRETHNSTHREMMIKFTEHHLRISHLEDKPTVRYKS